VTTAPPTTWTTRTLLEWISGKLTEREVDSPRRMAELLLAHVIGCDRLRLYMETDRLATDDEKLVLRDLVKRAMSHEPIQYLVGKETFYSLEFKTDARALIPRPSSQTIIDEAIRMLRPAITQTEIRPEGHDPDFDSDDAPDPASETQTPSAPLPASATPKRPEPEAGPPLLIADVCTGTGCLAITLAKNLPGARLIATDISADALSLARENAEAHSLTERVEFVEGDLLVPLKNAGPFDAIVSNPPYIPDSEWDAVEPNVKDHEPELALRAGPDALRLVSPLIEHGPGSLKPGGVLLIELASCSAADALKLARSQPMLENARILKDIDGLDRVLAATRILN
jgi:release factor glutamine methyltransferase